MTQQVAIHCKPSYLDSLQQLMNYYTSLVKTIDQLKAQGKEVKLTQLPSVVNIKRKSIKFWFLTTTVHLLNVNYANN